MTMESIENLREYGHDCCARIDDAIKELADAIEAEVAEYYVALPTDADGEPIHIGDVMEWSDGETLDVSGIGMQSLFYVDDPSGRIEWTSAYNKRHHHEPTVEDVLREFFSRYVTTKPKEKEKEEDDAIIAEYAAKLRLADGKEQ